MEEICTPLSWGLRAAVNFRRARRKRLAEMAAWVGVPEPNTKWIPLGNGQKAIVDGEWYDILHQWNWSVNNYGYATRRKDGKITLMHRVIIGALKGQETDHRNHDKLDNRRSNLRICTTQQNQFNRLKHKECGSRFKGVGYDNNREKWIAFCKHNKKTKNLGRFNTEIEAALAYDAWVKEHRGEFACGNFI